MKLAKRLKQLRISSEAFKKDKERRKQRKIQQRKNAEKAFVEVAAKCEEWAKNGLGFIYYTVGNEVDTDHLLKLAKKEGLKPKWHSYNNYKETYTFSW